MRKLIPTTLIGVAGLAAIGLIGMQAPLVNADEAVKREDDVAELVLVADDDDDDTNDNTNTNNDDTNTGFSRATNDNTNSKFTAVSRDRDLSRSDKTRDWTRDGGTRTRDWSANKTNDKSRNDTRGRR